MKKGVLRNFTKFTRKDLCQGLFFNKVAGLRPATFLITRLWHRCFLVNFPKFLITPFLQNTSGRLLLNLKLNIRKKKWLLNFFNRKIYFQSCRRISKFRILHRSLRQHHFDISDNPANIYLFKVNKRSTKKRCEICSKLTMTSFRCFSC